MLSPLQGAAMKSGTLIRLALNGLLLCVVLALVAVAGQG
jgi:hypothetical protein